MRKTLRQLAGLPQRGSSWFLLLTCSTVLAGFAAGQEAQPGDPLDNFLRERQHLEEQFGAKLEVLAAKCEELGLRGEAEKTRRWRFSRDPERNYLFFPADQLRPLRPERTGAERVGTTPPETSSDLVAKWQERFRSLRNEHAGLLFELAKRFAATDLADRSFQLLHEVLREDPEHVEARRILGHKRVAQGWDVPAQRIRSAGATLAHPTFGWKRGTYWRIESDHFRVTTNHSVKEGLALAEQLERFHSVWRQLYFRFWSRPEALAARFAGRDEPLGSQTVFTVVLFRNRDEYTAHLSQLEPQIAQTLGYYHDRERTAFFYAGDASPTTRFHEVTHQLFQESQRAGTEIGSRGNFWVLEGIAQYMESYQEFGAFAVVGGLTADRLQFARARVLSGEFAMPLAELVALDRKTLQADSRIRLIYSHAAGLTHFLMDGDRGSWRLALLRYLTIVYAGSDDGGSLRATFARVPEELDAAFRRDLLVDDARLEAASVLPLNRNLCLSRTEVTDRGLGRLSGVEKLEWLDLSGLPITDAGFAVFQPAQALRQLNLERTRISDMSLATIGKLRELEELDLSGLPITDQGIALLRDLRKLKILWLTDTRLTDDSVPALLQLKQLEQLDVDGTRVTPAGRALLRRGLPKVNW